MDEQKARELAKEAASQCIGLRLRFLSRVVSKIYDQALKPLDIKGNQATMLLMLFINGDSTPGKLGTALQMEKSTVSRNLERMRKKGWIGVSDRGHGSSQVITVTPKGKELLAAVHSEWAKAQHKASGLLGDEGVRALSTLYDTIRGGVQE